METHFRFIILIQCIHLVFIKYSWLFLGNIWGSIASKRVKPPALRGQLCIHYLPKATYYTCTVYKSPYKNSISNNLDFIYNFDKSFLQCSYTVQVLKLLANISTCAFTHPQHNTNQNRTNLDRGAARGDGQVPHSCPRGRSRHSGRASHQRRPPSSVLRSLFNPVQ